METLEVTTEQFKRCDMVKVTGRVDSYTSPALEAVLSEITEDGRYRIVIDMSQVSFVSSKGWWVLIEAQKKCRRYNRGEVVLACLDEKISGALELIGLTDYFKLFEDVTAAVGSF